MTFDSFLLMQRDRIRTDRTLDEDIRKRRFATAGNGLSVVDDERRAPVEYPVAFESPGHSFRAIERGYFMLKMLYA